MSHKHEWKDVSYDFVWTYNFFKCSSGSAWHTWHEFKVYQKKYLGSSKMDCSFHDYHLRYPEPQTIVHQKCVCGEYREQYVDGILNELDNIKCKEVSTSEDVRNEIDQILENNRKTKFQK